MHAFSTQLTHNQARVNAFLKTQLHAHYEESLLRQAMEYALLLGGKRIRPFLVYATGEMLGVAPEVLDAPAAAIEAIHAYSLIHDDLPAMDNDALRRGQPTCHIAFDEATAILAGDALQPFAFELLTHSPFLNAEQKVALTATLAKNSGAKGMCLGQSLDLLGENRKISLMDLEKIHRHKTGALLNSAVKMGLLCSAYAQDEDIGQALATYSNAIGLAFQVQDDILDLEGESAIIGKKVGADLEANKSTYPKLLGLAGAKEKAQDLYQTAISALSPLPFDTQILRTLAQFIVQRNA